MMTSEQNNRDAQRASCHAGREAIIFEVARKARNNQRLSSLEQELMCRFHDAVVALLRSPEFIAGTKAEQDVSAYEVCMQVTYFMTAAVRAGSEEEAEDEVLGLHTAGLVDRGHPLIEVQFVEELNSSEVCT